MNNLTYKLFNSLFQSEHQKRSRFYFNYKCLDLDRDQFSQENLSLMWCGVDDFIFSGLLIWAGSMEVLLHRPLMSSSWQMWKVDNTHLIFIDGEIKNQRRNMYLAQGHNTVSRTGWIQNQGFLTPKPQTLHATLRAQSCQSLIKLVSFQFSRLFSF